MPITIEEAIQELERHSELILVAKNPALSNAVRLGLEALKLIKRNRRYTPQPYNIKLPGEPK